MDTYPESRKAPAPPRHSPRLLALVADSAGRDVSPREGAARAGYGPGPGPDRGLPVTRGSRWGRVGSLRSGGGGAATLLEVREGRNAGKARGCEVSRAAAGMRAGSWSRGGECDGWGAPCGSARGGACAGVPGPGVRLAGSERGSPATWGSVSGPEPRVRCKIQGMVGGSKNGACADVGCRRRVRSFHKFQSGVSASK